MDNFEKFYELESRLMSPNDTFYINYFWLVGIVVLKVQQSTQK